MKKFLKVIGVIVLLLVAFVLIAGLFISKTYHLERNITINAPREKVWNNVSTLHGIQKWNPWSEKDPNIKGTYEGQDGTVGATYKWDGNKDVGSGNQSLTKLEPMNRVETTLHFIKPMEGEASSSINLTDQAPTATKVTWGFDTRHSYPMNVTFLFMDKMMSSQFDKGLNKLKALCETN